MAELDDELECVGGCVLLFGCANWHYPYHGDGGGLSFCDEMSLFPRRGRYDAIELLCLSLSMLKVSGLCLCYCY